MPRAGWLACGALVSAFACTTAAATDPRGAAGILGLLALAAVVLAGAVTVAVGGVLRRSRVALFGVGILVVALRVGIAAAGASAVPDPGALPLGAGSWMASIVRLGSIDGALQRALLSVTPAAKDVATAPSTAGPGAASGATVTSAPGPWPVYAWLPRYPAIAIGDQIAFSGRLEPAPAGPGFGDVLRSQGAAASVRPSSFTLVQVDRGVLGGIDPIRRAAGERLFAVLPAREAGLASGILIGLRELVDRTVAANFTTAGLSHVVAISGWNIAQVAAVMVGLLRWLPRRPRSLVVIAAIVVYTLLAGASASVVRAAVMGSVALLARESGRRGSAASALGLAIAMLIVLEPAIATDIGFQLSAAATAGLLAWATPLQKRFALRAPSRLPRWLVETMAVSTAAQASTLPLVLFHFGRLSLISPVANVVAAPVIAPVMLLCLVGLVAGGIAALGVPVLLLAPSLIASWAGLAALIAIADISAAIPLASLTLPPPLDVVAAALAAAGVVALGTPIGRSGIRRLAARHRRAPRDVASTAACARPAPVSAPHPVASAAPPARPLRPPAPAARAEITRPSAAEPRHRRRLVMFGGALAATLVLASGAVLWSRPDGRFRVTALDVGQGDAILVEGDHGARMLIDGGPDPDVLTRRLDERIPSWDRRLDLLVLSHPHEDHVGGLPLLLKRFHVGTIADTGMLGNGPADHAFRQQLADAGISAVKLAAGDHVQLDSASAAVLWPRAGEVPLHPANSGNAVNDVSIVFDIRFGVRRFLLTGDVEQEIDPELLAGGVGDPSSAPVDVLKVAHHGSKTASTDAFLRAVQPRVAFVSAGIGNPYGHPAPSTIGRLQAIGARVLRTDTDGTLVASSDGRDLAVSADGPHTAPGTPRPTAAAPTLAFSCAVTSGGPSAAPARTASNPSPPIAGASPASSIAARSSGQVATAALARPGGFHVRQSLVVRGPLHSPNGPAPGIPCYDRPHDHPFARPGRRRPPRPRRCPTAGPPHDRRSGDRRIPGRSVRGARRARRPPPG